VECAHAAILGGAALRAVYLQKQPDMSMKQEFAGRMPSFWPGDALREHEALYIAPTNQEFVMKFNRSLSIAMASATVALASLACTTAAQARDVSWSVGVSVPGVVVGAGNSYYRPAPVYVQPAPVYVAPQPVYQSPVYAPSPVYYESAPVYYGPPRGYGYYHHHHHGYYNR
jgi:ABC-type Fe3+ transport system permease subunit